MQKEIEIIFLPEEVEQTEIINQKLAEALNLSESRIKGYAILKKVSIMKFYKFFS